MRTAADYLQSLRERNLELWVDGERAEDPVSHPKIRPAINSIAATYALAHDPEHRHLAVAHSDIIDGPVNRFTHLFRQPEDLVRKVELQRALGRVTGTCFQRCVGMDGLNSLFIATWEAGKAQHARFVDWLARVQRDDDVICGAMTDPKGDRSKRPPEQPDSYLRVVERRDGGIVIRGAKMHLTGAANSHQILAMPGMALREGEEDFAFAAAMPVDAPGVRMVLGRQPSEERKGGADAGNARYGGQEVVVMFDDVFVPWERVFLDGELHATATLVDAFAGYHRASYGGCKPGNLDALVGASSLLAKKHGVRKSSHVRDKLTQMAHLTETIHGLGLSASHKSTQHGSGLWQVDRMLANVCKQHVTNMPYEVVRIAEDLAGGQMATMPSLKDLQHPEIGEKLQTYVGDEERTRVLRFVEWMAYGSGSVPLRIECMHGAGSPQAQRIVIEREVDWEARMAQARRLAGLDPDDTLADAEATDPRPGEPTPGDKRDAAE